MASFDLFGEYSEDELFNLNIQHLGFRQRAWDYSRGARTERRYECITEPGTLKIRDYFTYTYDADNRNVETVRRHIEWYKMDGTVGLTKEIVKEFTPKSLGQLNKEIRDGRLKDLTENAKAVTGGDAIVDAIYSWYGGMIYDYIDRGTLDFENALRNETDPTRLGLLNQAVPEFGGLSVMQLLSFQLIGEYSWT
jgi:hypothetical protein